MKKATTIKKIKRNTKGTKMETRINSIRKRKAFIPKEDNSSYYDSNNDET